ncbi:MAG: hypothetical protein ACRDSN_06410, partial [Pseudonocardiaceae bacterium]
GWVFRDRFQFIEPFPEPPPVHYQVPEHLLRAQAEAPKKHSRTVTLTVFATVGVLGFFVLASACAAVIASGEAAFTTFMIGGLLAAGFAVPIIAVSANKKSSAMRAVALEQQRLDSLHAHQTHDWRQRKANFEAHQHARVHNLDEWGAATTAPGTRRVDIFGGNLWAWQAFLTVYGTSALAARPVIVLDLSRELVSYELAHLANAAGVPVDAQLLPDQLATTTLLHGLPAQYLVDALIESMYGDNPAAARSERSMDDRILTAVCEYLGDNLSMGRLAAGLRALMGQPDPSGYLTAKERNHITDELFSADYRQHAQQRLQRLEAHIKPLETLGVQSDYDGLGYLTCMAMASDTNNPRSELLTDLLVQWLTTRIAADLTSIPEVIIAGADVIALRHLERLSDACERRNIRLTVLFRHLRNASAQFIGGGVTGFMKMGNATEATQAAEHIGKQHKFVVSQITHTLGGSETHTDTET